MHILRIDAVVLFGAFAAERLRTRTIAVHQQHQERISRVQPA
jgi:hypothetical protein